MRRVTPALGAAVALLLVLGLTASVRDAFGQSAQDFADWTSVGGNVASGTLHGSSISLSGTNVSTTPSSTVDGSSTVFNRAEFTPPLPASDAIQFIGSSGNSYTLQFGSPVTNPVLHLGSLASTLQFPAGTQITRLSGDAQFSVSASSVIGALDLPADDANGSVRLTGVFQSISFTTTFAGSDGIYLQAGAPPPPPPRPPPPPPAPFTFVPPKRLSDLPPPVLGRRVNVEPVSGEVTFASPGDTASARAAQKGLRFRPLREARQLPVGSFFDTRRGRVRLQTATMRRGRRQAGIFFSGVFQTIQSRRGSARGLTELRLKGSSFRSCAGAGHGGREASSSRHSKRRIRRLRGNARGRFSTRGRHSAATVRGTVWSVSDRCDGTLTKVTRGKVAVRDFRRRKNILLRAGKSYLARARR